MTGAQPAVVVDGGVDEPGAVAEIDRTAAEPGGGGIAAVGGIQLGKRGRERQDAGAADPVGDRLDAGRAEAGAFAVQLGVAAFEGLPGRRPIAVVDRPARQRDRQLGQLHGEAHVDLAVEFHRGRNSRPAIEGLPHLSLEVGEVLLRPDRVERHRRRVGQLGGDHDVGGRQSVRGERRRHLSERYDDLRHADLGGVRAQCAGPAPPKA